MKLGPSRFTITSGPGGGSPWQGDVQTEADQSPGVRLHGTVSFVPIDGGTRITEQVRIEAPRLLAGYTTREAVKAHVAMLAAIRLHFASR